MLRVIYLLLGIYLWIVRPLILGVRIMMIRDREVLLIRQTYRDGWFLPGGGIHKRETPAQAARREAREEVGAELGEITLLGAYSNFDEWKSDHTLLFLCRDFTLTARHDREVAEVRFFRLDALPPDLRPGHRRRLEEYERGLLGAEHGSPFPGFGEW